MSKFLSEDPRILKGHGGKFCRYGDLAPGICVRLFYTLHKG